MTFEEALEAKSLIDEYTYNTNLAKAFNGYKGKRFTETRLTLRDMNHICDIDLSRELTEAIISFCAEWCKAKAEKAKDRLGSIGGK